MRVYEFGAEEAYWVGFRKRDVVFCDVIVVERCKLMIVFLRFDWSDEVATLMVSFLSLFCGHVVIGLFFMVGFICHRFIGVFTVNGYRGVYLGRRDHIPCPFSWANWKGCELRSEMGATLHCWVGYVWKDGFCERWSYEFWYKFCWV